MNFCSKKRAKRSNLAITTSDILGIIIKTIVEIVAITTELKTKSFDNCQNRYNYGNRFKQNKQNNKTFSRENSFRQKEYAAKQYYESENSQFKRNQANSNIRPTLNKDPKSYNTQNENKNRWVQQVENNTSNFVTLSQMYFF